METDADAPQEDDQFEVTPELACLNCGAERLGDYCQGCGQYHLDNRLTLRVVWREFAERFLKLERGLAATVLLALRNPGGLARRYVAGERRRFVNPISFLLIGSAISVLLLPISLSSDRLLNDPSFTAAQPDSTQLSAQFEAGMRIGGGDPTAMTDEERGEAINKAQEFQTAFLPIYLSTVQKLYSVFSLALVLVLAGLFKLFFSGRTPTYTFAETMVAACYLSGIYLILAALSSSLLAPFAPILYGTVLSFVLLIGLAAYAETGFYERSTRAAMLGALSGLVGLVGYTVIIILVAVPLVVVQYIFKG